jgi:hypothetical protein
MDASASGAPVLFSFLLLRLVVSRVHTIATVGFRLVEGAVRHSDQRLGRIAGPVLRDTEACRQRQVGVGHFDA